MVWVFECFRVGFVTQQGKAGRPKGSRRFLERFRDPFIFVGNGGTTGCARWMGLAKPLSPLPLCSSKLCAFGLLYHSF